MGSGTGSYFCLFSLNCCVGVTHTCQMMNWTYIKSLADTSLKIMKASGVFVLLLLLTKLQLVFKALVLKSNWFLTTLWFQKLVQNSLTHLTHKTLKSCRHLLLFAASLISGVIEPSVLDFNKTWMALILKKICKAVL